MNFLHLNLHIFYNATRNLIYDTLKLLWLRHKHLTIKMCKLNLWQFAVIGNIKSGLFSFLRSNAIIFSDQLTISSFSSISLIHMSSRVHQFIWIFSNHNFKHFILHFSVFFLLIWTFLKFIFKFIYFCLFSHILSLFCNLFTLYFDLAKT